MLISFDMNWALIDLRQARTLVHSINAVASVAPHETTTFRHRHRIVSTVQSLLPLPNTDNSVINQL